MAAWKKEDQWCVVAVGALGTAVIVSASEFIRSDLDDVGSEFCDDHYFTTDAPKEPGFYRWEGVIVGDDAKWCGSEPIEPWAEMRGEWKPIPDPVPKLEARIAELVGERDKLLSIKRLFTNYCNKIVELADWSADGNGNLDLEWAADKVGNALSNAHLIDIGAYRPGVYMPPEAEEEPPTPAAAKEQ
jgi:hypothetical protein